MVVEVPEILLQVDMHEQRLAGASRHPKRQLVEVLVFEMLRLVHRGAATQVPLVNEPVQGPKQRRPVSEVPVEVYLREEKCQVLEVLKSRSLPLGWRGDLSPVAHDALVVGEQH